jgi:glutamine synthetase
MSANDSQMSKQQEFVLRTIEERNIRFIRLWFTDVLGYLKSVAKKVSASMVLRSKDLRA